MIVENKMEFLHNIKFLRGFGLFIYGMILERKNKDRYCFMKLLKYIILNKDLEKYKPIMLQ